MARQSLSELLSGVEGLPGVTGIVDAILKNENGDIVQHEHKHNMITDAFRTWLGGNDNSFTSAYIFIHENTEAMHQKRSAMRTVLPGTWAQNVSQSFDGPNRIWTFATVFDAPPTTRTFKTVGLTRGRNTSGYTGVFEGPNSIIAATVLSATITQEMSQTLEVNYRLAFQRS